MTDRILNVVLQYLIAPPKEAASLLSQIVHLALSGSLALSIPGFHSYGAAGPSGGENPGATLMVGAPGGPGFWRNTMDGKDGKDEKVPPGGEGANHGATLIGGAPGGPGFWIMDEKDEKDEKVPPGGEGANHGATMVGAASSRHRGGQYPKVLPAFSENRRGPRVMSGRTVVHSLALSPNGQRLACACDDGTFQIWDLTNRTLELELKGHSYYVTSVAFSPNGERVASGSDDSTVRIWDVKTGQLHRELKGHSGSVNSVAFSPNGERVASGSDDKTILIWDAATGELKQKLKGHSHYVNSVAFSPKITDNPVAVASGGKDGRVMIWDSATGTRLGEHKTHAGWVKSVAFSPNGDRVAIGSTDKTVRIFVLRRLDAAQGLLRFIEPQVLDGDVVSIAFSPDGRHVAGGGYDDTIRIWNVGDGKLHQELKGHRSFVYSVAFSPDSRFLFSASEDNTIRIWTTNISLSELEGVINSDGKNRIVLDLKERLTEAGIDVDYMKHKLNNHSKMFPDDYEELQVHLGKFYVRYLIIF